VVNNNLATALSDTGPFTVFAPINSAMPDNLQASEANGKILTYHVVPSKIMAADLKACQVVTTVNGKKLKISKNAAGEVLVGTAKVNAADLGADNGVVHSIDGLLTPPADSAADPMCTVVDVAVSSADHTDLVTAVVNNNLATALSDTGPFTVFAPINSAMPDNLQASEANGKILTYHVVPSKIMAADLKACQVVTTVNGKKLKISKNAAGEVLVGTAKVNAADLGADNGVVHSIDGLLTPPADSAADPMCQSGDVSGASRFAMTSGAAAVLLVIVR